MKKTVFILMALLSVGFAGMAQDGTQLCKAYFPLQEGTELTYENYDRKEKLTGTDYMKVKEVIELADKMTIKVHSWSKDKKGEEVYSSDFEYICENGVFKMSMESMMNGQMMEAYKDMEVTVTQTELEMPSDLKVGETLPDAEMTMEISSNGMKVMTMNIFITDRKIEAKESITTPAGTFEAYKLAQNSRTKMMFLDKTFKSVDWFVPNVGSVRSENYSESGKLESYRVLTNIKR